MLIQFKNFFAMGGYAFYVWTSYAIVSSVLLFNVISAFRNKRKTVKDVSRKIKSQPQ